MSAKVGDRVMALVSASEGVVLSLGEGVLVAEEVPPLGIGLDMLAKFGRPNPTILLDSGEKVYGAEMWWGSVEAVKKKFAGWEFKAVTVAEFRQEKVGHGG